jgi:sugar phosphate isomerase/epimerase
MGERRLKIAVPTQVLDEDVRAAAVRARQLGVEGLEVPAYTGRIRLPDLSATGRREFRHVLAGQKQELAAVHVDCGPRGLGPGADVDRVINGVDRAMEVARGLGAGLVTVEVGPLPEPVRKERSKPKVTQEMAGLILIPSLDATPAEDEVASPANKVDPAAIAQVDGALAELGRRADRYGVAVAFHSDLSSYAALDRALAAAACPWFGVDLDPAGVLRDEWAIDEVLSRLGALVRHVRARDAVRGADRRTRPAVVGQGNVDWAELTALLDEAGYHGWVTIDPTELPDRAGAVRAGVERVRVAAGLSKSE